MVQSSEGMLQCKIQTCWVEWFSRQRVCYSVRFRHVGWNGSVVRGYVTVHDSDMWGGMVQSSEGMLQCKIQTCGVEWFSRQRVCYSARFRHVGWNGSVVREYVTVHDSDM